MGYVDEDLAAPPRRASEVARAVTSLVGAAVKRKEDARLVAGQRPLSRRPPPARDCSTWSSCAARTRTPTSRASTRARRRAIDGVVAVLTRAELPELAGSVPPLVREPKRRAVPPSGAGRPDRVRHVGEAVAVVVAVDPYRAADGAAAVTVEYAPLPAATRAATAVAATDGPAGLARQPLLHEDVRRRRRRARLRGGRRRRAAASHLSARRRHADRAARCDRAARGRGRPHRVDVDAGAVRRARRDRQRARPAGGARARDRARDRRRLRRQGPRLSRGRADPRRRPPAGPPREVGGDAHASTCSPPPPIATRSTTRASASRPTARSPRSRRGSRATTARSRRWARPSRSTPSITCPARTACRTTRRPARTSSPTRRSSPPIAARDVPRPRSCSIDCSTAPRARAATIPSSCAGATSSGARRCRTPRASAIATACRSATTPPTTWPPSTR